MNLPIDWLRPWLVQLKEEADVQPLIGRLAERMGPFCEDAPNFGEPRCIGWHTFDTTVIAKKSMVGWTIFGKQPTALVF